MTIVGWIEIAIFCAVIIALVRPPLGGYMTRVFGGEHTLLLAGPPAPLKTDIS